MAGSATTSASSLASAITDEVTCALTGYRLDTETTSIVQAAHIHQHAVSGSDDPRNGLALTPTGHVAFAPVQTAYKPSAVFSATLRKLGLRDETIGYGPTKEKWEALNRERQEN